MINTHFIPVMITVENVDEVEKILIKHLPWISDEWGKYSFDYKLYKIKSGILKI